MEHSTTEGLNEIQVRNYKQAAWGRGRNIYVWYSTGVLLNSSIHLGMVPYTDKYWIFRPDGTVSPHQAIGA